MFSRFQQYIFVILVFTAVYVTQVVSTPVTISSLEVFPVMVGDTSLNITLETFPVPFDCESCELNLSFLNLHENENTSVVAVRNFLYFNGGKLVKFNKGDSRLVTFVFKNSSYSVDPNRIFTTKGITDSLLTYNPSLGNTEIPDDLVSEVAGLAASVLSVYDIDAVPVVLALHNNGGSYGANSYLPGGPYENDAAEVYISAGRDPSDFYYVVDMVYYEYLSAEGREYNVVLQDDASVSDDGSLSYYCGQAHVNKQYVNFEAVAETGAWGSQVVVQLDMLQEVKRMLGAVSASKPVIN